MVDEQTVERPTRKHEITLFAFLVVVGVLVFSVYRLGLPGDFMFDDYPNLEALSAHGGVTDLQSLKLYLGDGFAGPTGRPISMLSFLIDVREWPADPGAIKYKNILIHLLNGLLLTGVLILALRQSGLFRNGNRILWVAGITAAVWLVHPLHVSTVLYAIQRMAELSTLFVLIGLGGYLLGRARLATRPWLAHILMAGSLVIGTVLATYSKENGALLPLLVLVLEGTLLTRSALRPDWRFKAVFLWLPSLALVAYLVKQLFSSGGASEVLRGFTPWERLLSESRILFDYLGKLFVPQPHTEGIFRDSLTVSHGLMDPPVTLLAVLGVVSLIALAVALRRRLPLVAAAIGFYLAGHLLESTTIPLELYFEHRNYLPSLLLFLPIAQLLTMGSSGLSKPAMAGGLVLIFGLMAMTATRADLWSDRTELYLMWAGENPDSPRAQLSAANVLQHAGKKDQAINVIEKVLERHPDHLALNIYLHNLKEDGGSLSVSELTHLQRVARTGRFSNEALSALQSLTDKILRDSQQGQADVRNILKIWGALAENSSYTARAEQRKMLHFEQGRLLANLGQREEAVREFQAAMAEQPTTETGFMQAAILATHGFYCSALVQLGAAENVLDDDPAIRGQRDYYRNELHRLRQLIQEDAEEAGQECEFSSEGQPASGP